MTNENKKAPDILYHYTSIDAFINILATKKMRATRFDQMNDNSEIKLGVINLLKAVKNYKVDNSLNKYKKYLISVIERYKEINLQAYVLSFSSILDSLDQWRSYAPKGGVAIGFDRKMVQKGFLIDITPNIGGIKVKNPIRPDPSNQLMECKYTNNNGKINLHSTVEDNFFRATDFIELFRDIQTYEPKKYIFHIILLSKIYQIICSVKHGAYISEEEWRSVNYNPQERNYPRKLDKRNRWYIEMEFDPKAYIKEVWISPQGDKKSYKSIINFYKEEYSLSYVIKNSKIPYRG